MIPENSLVKEAMDKIDGKWVICILVELIYLCCISLSSFISILVAGPLTVGKMYFYYKILNNEDAKIEDMFTSLNSKIVIKAIIVWVLFTLGAFFFTLLLVIPGIIFALRYAFVILITADKPDASTESIFSESHEMMKGHKGELFKYGIIYVIIVGLLNMIIYFSFFGGYYGYSFFTPIQAISSNILVVPINAIAFMTFILYYLRIKSKYIGVQGSGGASDESNIAGDNNN